MNKLFLSILFIVNIIYAKQIEPTFFIESKGLVNDFVIDRQSIYVANDEGSVEVFDLLSKAKIDEIFLDPIFTTKQEWQNVKVLSVDRLNGKTLIVSSTNTPYREVWLHDGKSIKQIVKVEDKISVKEARFVTEDKFIYGSLSYEMILYNIGDSYNSYKKQVEQSSFEDLELSVDKKTMVTSSESGEIVLSDVSTGKILKKFPPLNLDKVYQVAYKNGVVITGGQDRRVGVYPKESKPYYIKSEFLVYSVALSPNANIGIYASDMNSNLQIFDIKTGKKLDMLVGSYAIPTTIKFYDEKGVFSAGYENKIFYWRID